MRRELKITFAVLLVMSLAAITWASIAQRKPSRIPNPTIIKELPTQSTQGELTIIDKEGKLGGMCPLKHTDVKADISGFLVRATVTQEFENTADHKIEAVYTFPLPQNSAVDDMTMLVGGRTVKGKIKKREEAKQIYEDARRNGNVASLLDQERPNIFTQSVANIPPGAKVFDLPSTGTIPHALVQAYPTEEDAFRAVAETLPSYSLLLDTYDVHAAIETAVAVAKDGKLRFGHEMTAVRLDSGDLLADSLHVRRVLDAAGLADTKVLVSGDIDEFRIADLLAAGAPIDGFGVGGNLAVGLGTVGSGTVGGVLGAVYKLAWYEGAGDPARIKLAGSKTTWPGRKLVYRLGDYDEDVIQLDDEPAPANGRALLEPAIQGGEICADLPPVMVIQSRALANVRSLPPRYRALTDPPPYPVRRADSIVELRERASERRGQAVPSA